MKISMKWLLGVLLFGASLLGLSASAQTWPTKSVRIVIPFAPGGGTDILVRIMVPKLTELLGQPVVVDNKPGGSSIIGTQLVTQSAPDGYTLVVSGIASHVIATVENVAHRRVPLALGTVAAMVGTYLCLVLLLLVTWLWSLKRAVRAKTTALEAEVTARAEKELDEITGEHVEHIDKALERKEKELLEV